jgi:hypothetical protein
VKGFGFPVAHWESGRTAEPGKALPSRKLHRNYTGPRVVFELPSQMNAIQGCVDSIDVALPFVGQSLPCSDFGTIFTSWFCDWRGAGLRSTTMTITYNGKEFDADAAASLMDDELREELHSSKDWASEQEFFDAYVAAHAAKFGEDFVIN